MHHHQRLATELFCRRTICFRQRNEESQQCISVLGGDWDNFPPRAEKYVIFVYRPISCPMKCSLGITILNGMLTSTVSNPFHLQARGAHPITRQLNPNFRSKSTPHYNTSVDNMAASRIRFHIFMKPEHNKGNRRYFDFITNILLSSKTAQRADFA